MSSTPTTIEETLELAGTKWHSRGKFREIIGFENLIEKDGKVHGDVYWKEPHNPAIRKTDLRFFRGWLTDDKRVPIPDQPENEALRKSSLESLSIEYRENQEAVKDLELHGKELYSKIAQLKSIQFIKDNGITLDKVQVFEESWGYIHDGDKLFSWIRERINNEWFVFQGRIIRSEGFCKHHMYDGTDARYIDLVALGK